jgi:ABC-type transporter Mla subunit MlaD
MAALDLGNGYQIDLAEADKFVNVLRDAFERLQTSLDVTASNLQVLAPGNDDYSGTFANTYNEVIRQHKEWNQKRQQELKDLIDRVSAAVDGYRHAEHDNTMRA